MVVGRHRRVDMQPPTLQGVGASVQAAENSAAEAIIPLHDAKPNRKGSQRRFRTTAHATRLLNWVWRNGMRPLVCPGRALGVVPCVMEAFPHTGLLHNRNRERIIIESCLRLRKCRASRSAAIHSASNGAGTMRRSRNGTPCEIKRWFEVTAHRVGPCSPILAHVLVRRHRPRVDVGVRPPRR